MFNAILMLLFAAAPAASPVEPPVVAAQRAAAEALEVRAAFAEAGDAYVKLADLPDVDRRGALDRAHMNYDSAYLETNHPSRLCWALGVAEQVVREGGFSDDDQASYWRENVEDDLSRLQLDAKATQRANCRFDAKGAPRKVVLTTLTDDDFTELPPAVGPKDDRLGETPRTPAPVSRRRQVHTAAGAALTGIGVGLVGTLAGLLGSQARHATTLREMSAAVRAAGRDFTESEWRDFNAIRDEGVQLRNAAVGVGIVGVVSLTAGVALLATRKRVERKFAVQPYGGRFGAGAVFRVRF
jgi:hypothetical protein